MQRRPAEIAIKSLVHACGRVHVSERGAVPAGGKLLIRHVCTDSPQPARHHALQLEQLLMACTIICALTNRLRAVLQKVHDVLVASKNSE